MQKTSEKTQEFNEKKQINELNDFQSFPKVNFRTLDVTHNVRVRNELSVESDMRCFSIHCTNLSDIELYDLIKKYANEVISKKLKSKVFFETTIKNINTHQIVLGCKKPKEFKYKLIPLQIPDFCSDDIRKELQEYLWGLSEEEKQLEDN